MGSQGIQTPGPTVIRHSLKKLGGWMWVRHALVLLGGTERSGVSSNNTLCNGWEGGLALKLVALCSGMLASAAGNLNRFVNLSICCWPHVFVTASCYHFGSR